MAEKKDSNENPWADDQWDDFNDGDERQKQKPRPPDNHLQDHQHHKGKEGKKLSEKLGDGLHKTKEGASRSMKRVKEGASVGIFWMKDKFRKPAGQKAPPISPPPPLPNSSP